MSDGILSFRFILVSILISRNIKSKQRWREKRERERERERARVSMIQKLSRRYDPDAHETLNNIFSVLICHVTLISKHKSDILSRG